MEKVYCYNNFLKCWLWIEYYDNGVKHYEGEFSNGSWTGKGIWWKIKWILIIIGKTYDKIERTIIGENLYYKGDWKEEMIEGNGKMWFPDGSIYKGTFKSNQANGKGKKSINLLKISRRNILSKQNAICWGSWKWESTGERFFKYHKYYYFLQGNEYYDNGIIHFDGEFSNGKWTGNGNDKKLIF